ncbi:uroporphyrinogen decarboxylase family protein [Terrisporobacter vanillatitrophus]|uniref:uroporphyrinogen decarboxylase family protein n=1 Tax=Terrisporobacter vanillatitrophus TaxID=3058402 RepID=UPI003367ADD9
MLSKKQNLLETIRGGNPDRYVNQYEAFQMQMATPLDIKHPSFLQPGQTIKDPWGITFTWPEGTPGQFPVHNAETLVVKDITRWKDYVKMPSLDFSEEEWKPFVEVANQVDRDEYFVTGTKFSGLFEMCHYLLGIEECLINFYEEPEAMHELIDYLTEYELKHAEQICKHYKIDALFHHDDWGTQKSTFMSRDMFREFFLDSYKKIYKYYKDHGVEVIVHHSDCYCETLVPEMIEMGIDIWQGAMSTNNIPKIIEEYGNKITIMGGLDNGKIDRVDWTKEKVLAETEKMCNLCGTKYFIPSSTIGLAISIYDGVYDAVTESIDIMSKKMFK